jgi:hypothetical protein
MNDRIASFRSLGPLKQLHGPEPELKTSLYLSLSYR